MQKTKETWIWSLGWEEGPSPSPGEGHGNPLRYSCLENFMDRGAWWAMVHRAAKSQTRLKWLSVHACKNVNKHYSSDFPIFGALCKWNHTIHAFGFVFFHWIWYSLCSYDLFFWLHYSAAAAAAKSLQSCPTLCNPIDNSPPGSPVPGILQARVLEWGAISFSHAWKWKMKVKSLSRVRLSVTLWTVAHQTPPSTGFSRWESWSGVPLPAPAL